MSLPAYLLNNPHLPLIEGQTLEQVIPFIQSFYGVKLSIADYKPAQVYRGTDNLLALDLVDLDGKLVTQFIDRSSAVNTSDPTVVTPSGKKWQANSIPIPDKMVLKGLERMEAGFTFDSMSMFYGDWSYILTTSLNRYGAQPIWKSSSFADYSTAKFTVVYNGPSKSAPDDLVMPKNDDWILVIDILSGKNTGLVCFRVI